MLALVLGVLLGLLLEFLQTLDCALLDFRRLGQSRLLSMLFGAAWLFLAFDIRVGFVEILE